MKDILITVLLSNLLCIFLTVSGVTALTWQFWAIIITVTVLVAHSMASK